MLKAAADAAAHPWTKFSTGNSVTLKVATFPTSPHPIDSNPSTHHLILPTAPESAPSQQGGGATTREALLDFHGMHYYGSRLSLVLTSTQTLNQAESAVRAIFAAVPNAPRPPIGGAAGALLTAYAQCTAPNLPCTPAITGNATASCAPPLTATGVGGSEDFRSPFARESLPRLLHLIPLRELREVWPWRAFIGLILFLRHSLLTSIRLTTLPDGASFHHGSWRCSFPPRQCARPTGQTQVPCALTC